jgi:threonine dehydrogenase-like Zn-dependent dehydrogenase
MVEGIPLRCEIAQKLGADEVINFNTEDPVAAVKRLTDGNGADVVIEAVGGPAGMKAFDQAQDMTRANGTILLIGLYHKEPLRLEVHKVMNKKILGAGHIPYRRAEGAKVALGLLIGGQVRPQEMVTHRLDGKTEAVEAFRLLYERLDEAMCVTLRWDDD